MKTIQQILVIGYMVGILSAASAQTTNVIFQTDFDGDAGEGNYNGDWGGVYAGTDAGTAMPVVTGFGVTAGIGVEGTSANEVIADLTDLATDPAWQDASEWVYFNLDLDTDFSAPITPITPTSLMSSLILNADIQVPGLVSGQYGANVSITKLQFYDGNGNLLFDFNGYAGYVNANGFTHISVPLNTLTYNGNGDAQNPLTDFTNATVVGSIAGLVVEYQVNQTIGTIGGTGANQIMPVYGFTNAAVLVADNVELVQTGNTTPPPPTPMIEQVIWQANFDTTFPNDGDYGFSDRDGSPAATGSSAINPTNGVGGSASFEYTVDFSGWSSSPPVNYSGFGLGADESPLPYTLTSSSQASYRVSLSAKVGGTSAGVTSIPGQVDLSFFIPNGTEVYDLTAPFEFSTSWQAYEFDGTTNLQVATWLTGAQAMFNEDVTNVNKIELQLSAQGSPDIGAPFGYAADATMDIDNIKVVELVPGLNPLTITQSNARTIVTWTDPTTGGTAQLQSATNVAGPYTNVAGASSAAEASPYAVPPGSNQQFFRTIWIP